MVKPGRKFTLKRTDAGLIRFSITALAVAVLLFAIIAKFLWEESISAEEARVEALARDLGERAELIVVGARDMLDGFNQSLVPRCSETHLRTMHEEAISKPWIRAIGYWQAADRLCGVGFIQAIELKPSRADRIYDTGVIAWWPSSQTEVGGVQLFLVRYGDHDVAIDPRMLLDSVPEPGRYAGLWIEGLPMTSTAGAPEIPSPESVPLGLTVDREGNRMVSRFTLGTIFPIDIVAVEAIDQFWSRYLVPMLLVVAAGILLAISWVYSLLRYSRHRFSLSTQLRDALQEGRIKAQYQPIVDLVSHQCIGAEALAWWLRDDGDLVAADTFIPIAESAGLLPDITLAVLRSIIDDLGDLLRENPGLVVSINLASEDLASSRFLSALGEMLAKADLTASSIKLEITERSMINTDISRNLISAFRKRGHQVAIDDFGTGYSSLAYLQTFELDTLKIDKSFVDVIGTEAVTKHVIGHVIDMAKSLDLDTVAEGIETIQQASWLIEHGVTHGQGFLYSRPVLARDFYDYYYAHSDIKSFS